MARPLKPIDKKLVRTLAGMHCTVDEIAVACGCSKDTLERRFMAEIQAGRNEGKASLRRLQWLQAQKGNTAMLIWLGKQVLGQTDRRIDDEGDGTPFKLNYKL